MQTTLKNFLKTSPVSVNELAEKSGLSRQYIYNIAADKETIKPQTLKNNLAYLQSIVRKMGADMKDIEFLPEK